MASDYLRDRWYVENIEEWEKVSWDVPYLSFRSDWRVKIIPPCGGAMARFVVEKNGKTVSVYYDVYNRLGYYGEPYFEAYPINGEAARYSRSKVDDMINDIEKELNQYDVVE